MNALKILQTVLSNLDVPVYPIVIPESAGLPCIVTSMISERANSRLDDLAGQYEALVRIGCHAASPAAVMDLGEEVKTVLLQTVQAKLDNGNVLVNCFKATTDITDFSDDRTVYRRLMDFTVQWWI
ncbi:hypothetical protein [Pararhizobium gei]|uniref:hypothetical protein n=1 Tax=Pararhizobium gei TaxID=1395951 RepID=UPI0023DA1C99|nr:hypothetical protein [Rhizobium gei]